jgi:hypothetical protein
VLASYFLRGVCKVLGSLQSLYKLYTGGSHEKGLL